MMPRAKSNAEVIAARKAAVENVTSTTNWSDRFINADEFPEIQAAPNHAQYTWPKPPKLNPRQLELVGWQPDEIAI